MDLYELGPVPAPKINASVSYAKLLGNPELYYEGADIAFMIMASCLVFLMIPGLALLLSGVSDKHSTILLARLPLITTAFVGFQWYLWAYTLAFSPATTGKDTDGKYSWYGGYSKAIAFIDITARPVGIEGSETENWRGPKIPELVYALYQGMFACFTASIVSGAIMRKAPIGRFLFFISFWLVLVYCPVARWTWHPQGWSRIRGVMDFAGGTAVHVCSGATVAAYCVFFQLEVRGWTFKNLVSKPQTNHVDRSQGPNGSIAPQDGIPLEQVRREQSIHPDLEELHIQGEPPVASNEIGVTYNVTNAVLGTTLLWFGWFGFNGGSALGANLRAVSACISTHVAASTGGSIGLLVEWFLRHTSRAVDMDAREAPSVIGFCDGAIAGLVAITPAAGFVPVKFASVFGVLAAVICKFLRYYVRPRLLPYDILDICAVHAGAGFIGMVLTAFFASDLVTHLDGYSVLVNRTTGQRIRDQLLDVSAGFGYSFSMTFFILLFLKLLRFIHGRRNNGNNAQHRAVVIKDKLVGSSQHHWLQ